MNEEQVYQYLDAKFSLISADIHDLKSNVSNIKDELVDLKSDVTHIVARQNEQHDYLKAVLHNQEISNAKLEGLVLTTAKIESVQQVQREVNALGEKVYNLALAK